jgi:cell filamentation protein
MLAALYSGGMGNESRQRSDRYDVSGNPEAQYVDEARTVLINKKGITDLETLQIEEEEALARAYETLLSEIHVGTPLSCALLLHLHRRVFGDLYEWAGRWRTVWIRKPGITWPAPDFLAGNMEQFERNVLGKYPAEQLGDENAFCGALGEIQGEFLVIHPFREGNARTIKLASNLLSAQTGRPLLKYDSSDSGKERYIAAAKAAFKRDYAPMTEIIRQALARAQQ